MKGGGLTWAGWLMVGVGGMLVYAGMTGQSLVSELAGVLNGRSPKNGTSASGAPIGGVTDPANHPSTPGGNIPAVTVPPSPDTRYPLVLPPPPPRVPSSGARYPLVGDLP